MTKVKLVWLARISIGGVLGLLFSVALVPYIVGVRSSSPIECLLCTALGGAVGLATLPFADDGKSLLVSSGVHFLITAALFTLLMSKLGAEGVELLAWDAVLALLYAVVWLGRWIGWYMEVIQIRTLLGLEPVPSPLKWRETLPYLPFVLFLCNGLPLVLRWVDHAVSADVPVLSGLVLPYLLLPVGSFCAGLSLGKRQGLCPVYPLACFVCYLPMVYLLFNSSAMFHCFMTMLPALGGNLLGWLYRRAIPKKGVEL